MGEFASIDPKELVQQEGPNKGNIAGLETVPGSYVDEETGVTVEHPVVDGLARIGADAENGQQRFDRLGGETPGEKDRQRADYAGEGTIKEELLDRVNNTADATDATDDERRALEDTTIKSFRNELKSK